MTNNDLADDKNFERIWSQLQQLGNLVNTLGAFSVFSEDSMQRAVYELKEFIPTATQMAEVNEEESVDLTYYTKKMGMELNKSDRFRSYENMQEYLRQIIRILQQITVKLQQRFPRRK